MRGMPVAARARGAALRVIGSLAAHGPTDRIVAIVG